MSWSLGVLGVMKDVAGVIEEERLLIGCGRVLEEEEEERNSRQGKVTRRNMAEEEQRMLHQAATSEDS